jgi:hypothetical protein
VILVDIRLEVGAAAGFVETGGSDDDQLLALAQTLGVDGGLAADHTDGRQLCDLIGESHQIGDRAEGLVCEGGIEACEEDTLAKMDELEGEWSDLPIEELNFVDSDDVDLVNLSGSEEILAQPVAAGRDGRGIVRLRGVAGDRGAVIAQIDIGLVAGDALAGDAGPLEAADEFFRFSGEHGTGNDLKSSGWWTFHVRVIAPALVAVSSF